MAATTSGNEPSRRQEAEIDHEPAHAARVLDRDPPCDLAAERVAHDVGLLEPELLEQAGDVVGQVLGAQRPVDVRGAAVALEVGDDHAPARRELGRDGGEDLPAPDPAVEQDQRRPVAGAVLLVVHVEGR